MSERETKKERLLTVFKQVVIKMWGDLFSDVEVKVGFSDDDIPEVLFFQSGKQLPMCVDIMGTKGDCFCVYDKGNIKQWCTIIEASKLVGECLFVHYQGHEMEAG